MTRTFALMSVLCLAITLHVSAQKNVDEVTIKQLVSKNAASLGLSADDVKNTRVTSFYFDNQANVVMAYLQQTYKGVDVYNALTTVAFRDDKVVSVTSSRINDIDKHVINSNTKPAVTSFAALRNAASDINLPLASSVMIPLRKSPDGQEFVYDKLGIGFNNINVRLMWTSTHDDEHLKLSWQVGIHTLRSNDYWLIKVDAQNGRILRKENLTAKCSWQTAHVHKMECYEHTEYNTEDNTPGEKGVESVNSAKYNVIPYPFMDPDHSAPTLVTNPWTIFPNTNATSLKWNSDGVKDYDSTRGNNVYAEPDLDGNNNTFKDAPKSSTPLPDLTFNFTPLFNGDPVEEPATTNFGVTNLFYWMNIMHDMSYQYGFNEAAGNFQANNLGRGGLGNDFIYADGLDGDSSVIDNGNFATPVDGSNPRVQVGVFDGSLLKKLKINSPASYAGYKPSLESGFSINNKIAQKGPITANVVFFKDMDNTSKHNACGSAANPSELKGSIAYIDRRGCSVDEQNNFVNKVKNAQNAGAVAAIVGNNLPDSGLIVMGGTDNTITIPAVFITYEEAQNLKSFLNSNITMNATLSPTPRIDGELDNTVITHEFFHGVSTRLTGGPNNSNCLTNREQMGEGWSDYNALMMTTDWSKAKTTDGSIGRPIGNYAIGLSDEYGGIRWYPYSTDLSVNPWTYDSVIKSSRVATDIHTLGEVWCAMLWDLTWDLIKSDGINTAFWDASKTGGNTVAMKLVIEGLKLQKCSPGFVDGRDAILKADTVLFNRKYSGVIWKAFAKRGLGFSAKEGSTNIVNDGTAAYDLPAALPVVWGTFTAEKINNTALLKWTTVSEENVDRFVVERTIDGNNYAEIGSVKAKGNSTTTQSYTYTDLKPVRGNNIYRIRLIDRDGKYSYSDVKSLNFDDTRNLISIAPNPAKSLVILTVKENRKTLQVKLFNSLGQQLAAYVLTTESLPIDISKLNSGSYYISVTGDGINQKEKLIVQ